LVVIFSFLLFFFTQVVRILVLLKVFEVLVLEILLFTILLLYILILEVFVFVVVFEIVFVFKVILETDIKNHRPS